jgi:hypothetical protein
MIEMDNLTNIRQGRVGGLDRVIEAEATMKQEQCRLFPAQRDRHQLRAFNVEEQAHTFTKTCMTHSPSLLPAAGTTCATLPIRGEFRPMAAVPILLSN